jgi:hypothetical protein
MDRKAGKRVREMGRGRERVRGRESKGSKKCGRTGESEPAHPSLSPLIPSPIPHLQSCTSHSAPSLLYFPSCTCFPHLPSYVSHPMHLTSCNSHPAPPILHLPSLPPHILLIPILQDPCNTHLQSCLSHPAAPTSCT